MFAIIFGLLFFAVIALITNTEEESGLGSIFTFVGMAIAAWVIL